MATLSGNNAFLSIDGVDVSGFFTELNPTSSMASVDTTAGAGTNHTQRAEGLADGAFSAVIVYDVAAVSTYIQKLKPGLHRFIYGPEGNTAGKPKHESDYIVTEVSHARAVTKDMVAFSLSGDAADAPIADMYAGAVFAA